jgi:glycosyltransferase involved in cell wall biosynthesis
MADDAGRQVAVMADNAGRQVAVMAEDTGRTVAVKVDDAGRQVPVAAPNANLGASGTAAPVIRVLQVVRPAAGGIREHVLSLIRYSDHVAVHHALAAPSDFIHNLPDGLHCAKRHDLDIAAKPHILRDLSAANRLVSLVTTEIDVVHAHGLRAAWVAAIACRRKAFLLVVTAHNLPPSSRMTRIAVGVIAPAARRWIAVSQSVADGLMQYGAPPDRITVIPNGVDVDRFQSDVCMDLHFDGIDDTFVVGCVARLSPEKGVDVLLAAMRQMPDVPVVIAGDGPSRASLEADGRHGVFFLGRVDDILAVYKSCDVIAIPSRSEGQGIVALEAMAAGTPIVASRVGGLAEMLTDGETALLIPPDDPKALAAGILRLRDDETLREKLAENGLRLVRERYDVRPCVNRVASVYRALIRN